MALYLDVDGIHVEFCIDGYKNDDYRDDTWCECQLKLNAGNWLHYDVHGELLRVEEIKQLYERLCLLLNRKLEYDDEFVCSEPDFEFRFYSFHNGGHSLELHEISDFSLEWRVNLWNGYLTDNHISISLDRYEIEKFKDYLQSVITTHE